MNGAIPERDFVGPDVERLQRGCDTERRKIAIAGAHEWGHAPGGAAGIERKEVVAEA